MSDRLLAPRRDGLDAAPARAPLRGVALGIALMFAGVTGSAAEPPGAAVTGVRWGLLPVGNYSTDLGLQIGALGRRFDYGPTRVDPFASLLTVQATYATRGPRDALLEYERTRVGRHQLRIAGEATVSESHFQNYFGLGGDSQLDPQRARLGDYQYFESQWAASACVRKDFATDWAATLALGYAAHRMRAEQSRAQFAQDFGVGELRQNYGFAQIELRRDRRDSEFIAERGDLLSTSLREGASADWSRIDFDYRRFDPLIENRWLGIASQIRYAGATADAPLAEKPRLGSLGTLRGLPFNRYLANQSASLRVELRSVVLRTSIFGLPLKGGVGVFGDGGRVGDSVGEIIAFGPFGPSGPGARRRTHYGVGFTVFGSYFTDDFLGSSEFGFAEGQFAYYARLGHAF